MISFLESSFLIMSAFALITFFGIGPVLSCLPKSSRQYAIFVAPATGYILFCFFSIWISALSNSPVLHSNWWASVILTLWSLMAFGVYRNEFFNNLKAGKWVIFLFILMLMVVFFPAMVQGVDMYLGTVNPDFYQSLSFHESLIRFEAPFWVNEKTLPLHGPFLENFPSALQARFGGIVYSIFLEQLFHIPPRAAMITAIIAFLSSLPATVYFFSKTVLGFENKTAFLSAILLIIAPATTMSFLYSFMGQNSALASFPLTISLAFLALETRSLKLVFLVALILNGVFWLYVMALPYILVPIILFAFVTMFHQGWKHIFWLLGVILSLILISFLVHFSIRTLTLHFLKDLLDLLGNVKDSKLDLEFLTEAVFPYATGLSSYPISHNILFHHFSFMAAVILFCMAIMLATLYFVAVKLWSKRASTHSVIMLGCLLFTYISVWIKYTFFTRYGYASFKMISWLQFLVVPFFAWGAVFYIHKYRAHFQYGARNLFTTLGYGTVGVLAITYLSLNLISDLDYRNKSAGHDRYHGSIINAYGVSNNKDFPSLTKHLKVHTTQGKTVATGFGDSIQNFWAAYYIDLAGLQATILSHEEIPLEDAYLPDMKTRTYYDFLGNTQVDSPKFFHDGKADYYLLPANDNWNKDIVSNQFTEKPLWSNKTFALYPKEAVKDLVLTGRGFNRVEYMDTKNLNYWWPKVFRWSTEGGEVFQLFPTDTHQPYQIQLTAISGLGLAHGIRTLEFWHNGKKFDEVTINGAARVQSKSYFPTDGVNRLLIRIKEPAVLPPYHFGLWNKDLPLSARQINLALSDITINSIHSKKTSPWKVSQVIPAKLMFNLVESFNGFDIDGWVRDKAELKMITPLSAAKIRLKFLAPGNLGFKFPYSTNFVVNGMVHPVEFQAPGEHEVILDIPKSTQQRELKIEIYPSQVKQLAEGIYKREVLQSIGLRSIEFL